MDGHCQFNKRINHTYDIFRYVFYISDNNWFCNFIYGYMGLFDIYSKEVKMELDMKKEKHSSDESKQTLDEILLDIKYRLNHLEDIEADNRDFIIKLVKQTNQIVKFLSRIDIETVDNEYESADFSTISPDESINIERSERLKALLDEFMEKREDLQEFEKELKKYKDEITPGMVGEA